MNAKCRMQNAKLIRIAILYFAFCILHFSASAQTPTDRLIARALESNTAYETLSYLSDEIGPRLSGSANAALAVKYTTEQYRAWGFEVVDEPVMVPHWVRGVETASLPSHRGQKIILT